MCELNQTPETCVAYHRDRGEALRIPFKFESVDEYQYRGKGQLAAEYLYLYDNGKWSVYGLYNDSEWNELDVIVGNSKED